MKHRRGGGERNAVPGRTQADLGEYRTQDERPDYQGGRDPEERVSGTEAREGEGEGEPGERKE